MYRTATRSRVLKLKPTNSLDNDSSSLTPGPVTEGMDVEDLLGFENLVHIISAYCKCILENNTEYHPHSLKNNTEYLHPHSLKNSTEKTQIKVVLMVF
jgi:hypothetical protein